MCGCSCALLSNLPEVEENYSPRFFITTRLTEGGFAWKKLRKKIRGASPSYFWRCCLSNLARNCSTKILHSDGGWGGEGFVHSYAQTLILVNLIVVKFCIFENSCLTLLGCPVERFGRELEEIKPKRSRTSLSTPEPQIFTRKPKQSPDNILETIEQNPKQLHD